METGSPVLDATKAIIGLLIFAMSLYVLGRMIGPNQWYKDGATCKKGVFTGLFQPNPDNAYIDRLACWGKISPSDFTTSS